MNKPRLLSTNDLEELAHFRQHHDLTDFEDELEEVSEPVFARAEPPTATIVGVHWPDLDEDIGVEGWVLGKRSREGGVSLTGWVQNRDSC